MALIIIPVVFCPVFKINAQNTISERKNENISVNSMEKSANCTNYSVYGNMEFEYQVENV